MTPPQELQTGVIRGSMLSDSDKQRLVDALLAGDGEVAIRAGLFLDSHDYEYIPSRDVLRLGRAALEAVGSHFGTLVLNP